MLLNTPSKVRFFLSNFYPKTPTPEPSEIEFHASRTQQYAFIKIGESFLKLTVKSLPTWSPWVYDLARIPNVPASSCDLVIVVSCWKGFSRVIICDRASPLFCSQILYLTEPVYDSSKILYRGGGTSIRVWERCELRFKLRTRRHQKNRSTGCRTHFHAACHVSIVSQIEQIDLWIY